MGETDRTQILEEVAGHLRQRAPDDEAALRFVEKFYATVNLDDIGDSSTENLTLAALALWRLGEDRKHGHAAVRVYNPEPERDGWYSPHTVIEIVNDDMPFLVDSVANDLARLDLFVQFTIHPVVRVRRDDRGRRIVLLEADDDAVDALPESYIHIQVARQREGSLELLRSSLLGVLEHVRYAVEDWPLILAELDAALGRLERQPPPLPDADLAEGRSFLRWIRDHHFTFLGYRAYDLVEEDGKSYLRYRDGSGLGVLRHVTPESHARHNTPLSEAARDFAAKQELLIITKAYDRSTVHRPVRMDYIGVRTFGPDGRVNGERRFVGLFTSTAYNERPRLIPLLREKVGRVLERAGFPRRSHDGRALLNILETYPRDELFQIDADTLHDISLGILRLQERQHIALFVRRDPFEAFASCLVFVHRDIYSTALRRKFQAILEQAFGGSVKDYYTQVSDVPLARIQYVIWAEGDRILDPDVEEVERALIAAGRTWSDLLCDALVHARGGEEGRALWRRYREAFPIAYQERYRADAALGDIQQIEETISHGRLGIDLFRPDGAAGHELGLKIFHAGSPVPLSDILPVLEHMGLKVISEIPFKIQPDGEGVPVWSHDFAIVSADGAAVDFEKVQHGFEDLLGRSWAGDVEDDGFNRLSLTAALDWRGIVVLRAYCKFLRQAGIGFSETYMQETLAGNGELAELLVDLFRARFDPTRAGSEGDVGRLAVAIEKQLEGVANLDQDRILRRFHNAILATVRTNYYQETEAGAPKEYLSFKLDSLTLVGLPSPRPLYETFVYSPRVEAVHLRGGKVARGGIRWSDRREDFRTEVLGLMKAQMVKNAVIVPVGSKGGFIVKRPPAERDALLQEGVECYRTMMRGLLDLTDNRVGEEIVPPARVVRYDGDDPYLVVAADKGTATFSDIANGIAEEYGFWLADAFASGGSAGYDHKKMGITARGAWESVKRHHREFGKDIQKEDFTVVGVGDMSGDVFGNGMLLSRHIKLVGAFNHLHVFLDPDPDPEASFAERQRLFQLPRSTWADYDPERISPGGGVWPRTAKSIPLGAEARALLGVKSESLTPPALIRALLRARVDLMWFGGIGTYVKASSESHADVGDRANDGQRVDATELRCKVIGEGANLGLTQRGRIEYALAGGRLNTDAIDNSGGVDCSDHEVNIKIALRPVVQAGTMTRPDRDRLLVEMTDEVAELVLRDNYLQTQALTVEQAKGPGALDAYGRLMQALEQKKLLKRKIEFLPNDEMLADRAADKRGLTRPELSVLLAYAKISIYQDLLESDLPDDPLLEQDLQRYFPGALRERHREALLRHGLRREIIATSVTNSMVNRVGPTFVHDMFDRTGLAPAHVARAYAVTRDIFELRRIWGAVEALDNTVEAAVQTEMFLEIGRLIERATVWFLRNASHPIDMQETTGRFRPGVAEVAAHLDDYLASYYQDAVQRRARFFGDRGVPDGLAYDVARLAPLTAACDIVAISESCGHPPKAVARIHFAVGARFGLDRLRLTARSIEPENDWDKEAVASMVDDLYSYHRRLTASVLAGTEDKKRITRRLLDKWASERPHVVHRAEEVIARVTQAGKVDIPMLAVANRQIRAMVGE